MSSEKSLRACDRCRERRVKCDKSLPACDRCSKFGQPCPGYDKKRKFVDEGVALRKKFDVGDHRGRGDPAGPAPSHNVTGPPQRNGGYRPDQDLKTPESLSLGQQSGTSTLVPSHLTSTLRSSDHGLRLDVNHAETPIGENGSLAWNDALSEPLVEAFDPEDSFLFDGTWNVEDYDPQWFDLDPATYYGSNSTVCGILPHAAEIVDEVDHELIAAVTEQSAITSVNDIASVPQSDVPVRETQLNTSAMISEDREHEMAFLIRHFADTVGPWMDVFDRDRHFTQLVPLKALKNALLRNAVAAVSAKQLGRVQGQHTSASPELRRPAVLESVDNHLGIDWFYKAANYYDKAIAFSRQYLQAVSSRSSTPESSEAAAKPGPSSSDDLLVAVSLFSLYESLDSMDIGWLQHLAGLKSLFNTLDTKANTEIHIAPTMTMGRRASFWNFARADYQAAYINHKQTFLKTDDFPLWHGYDLQIQPNGSLYADPEQVKHDTSYSISLTDRVAHTLLWLILRTMNFLVIDDEGDGPQPPPTTRCYMEWQQLTRQFDSWFDTLPPSFQPCALAPHRAPTTMPTITAKSTTAPTSELSHYPATLTEVFYSIDICAAAMQLYHFARILLLLHRPAPHVDTSALDQPSVPHDVSPSTAIAHAHRILGIALGRPRRAVHVEMLLPLALAGGCLEADGERRLALDLLRAVGRDTGWSTEGKCRELVQGWGWSEEVQG